MASQRVFLFTIGGILAENIWKDICVWSDARTVSFDEAWSDEQWPAEIKCLMDNFVEKLITEGFTPPILYRSEHMDYWSMGDVYQRALVNGDPTRSRQLFTKAHEIIALWVEASDKISCSSEQKSQETQWLNARINEAIDSWSEFSERRLLILVRTVTGDLWTDDEVANSLTEIPSWWHNQTH